MQHEVTLDEQIHENMVAKGFYDMPSTLFIKLLPILTPDEMLFFKKAVQDQRLLLIISELVEAMEAGRKNRYCKLNNDELLNLSNELDDELFKATFEKNVKDTFENEIADARIRLLDYSGYIKKTTGVNISLLIELTTRYNKMRARLHGKTH